MGSIPTIANSVASTNPTGVHPAYLASANVISDPCWYMDSGVSNHITNDSENLDQVHEQYGKSEIMVGNGNKILVKNTGTSYLPCKSYNLKMTRVLHAPNITKNLLSVS